MVLNKPTYSLFSFTYVVDGNFTEWGSWGACSTTCGTVGTRFRTRDCSNPTPMYGGMDCQKLGDSEQTGSCPDQPNCPGKLVVESIHSFVSCEIFFAADSHVIWV